MTYMFQLVTPLLLVALLPGFDERSWAGALVAIALPIAFVANAHYFPLTFGRFRAAEATFAQLSDAIRAHHYVLGSTEVAGPLALAGQPVFDSGHSQYFGDAAIRYRLPGLVPADAIDGRWKAFLAEINARHRRRPIRFDHPQPAARPDSRRIGRGALRPRGDDRRRLSVGRAALAAGSLGTDSLTEHITHPRSRRVPRPLR